MPTTIDLWLCDPRGYRVAHIANYESLSYTGGHGKNEPGGITLDLAGTFPRNLIRERSWIEVWRTEDGYAPVCDETYIVLDPSEALAGKGTQFITLKGPSDEHLVRERVVRRLEGTTGASRTGAADTIMAQFVADSLAAGAGTGRDVSQSYGFTVARSAGKGPSVTVAGAFKPLADVIKDCADTAAKHASSPRRLYWRIVPTGFNPLRFQFRVWLDQPGANRTAATSAPVILGPDYGTLRDVELVNDHTAEATVAHVLYSTTYATVTDDRRHDSFGNYREIALTDSAASSEAAAKDTGRAELEKRRPKRTFRAEAVNQPHTIFGVHYRPGDKVTVDILGKRYNRIVGGYERIVTKDGVAVKVKLEEVV